MKINKLLPILTCALLATMTVPRTGHAAVPSTIAAEGLLSSSAGGSVADGNYAITFRMYQDAQGGQPVWSEGPLQVVVKNGAFSQPLGVTAPLSPSVTAAAGYLALQIAAEPELARKPLRSVVFSQRAAIAEALACSGCVTAGMLDTGVLQGVAKTADLAGYVKTSDLTGYVKTADLSEYVKASALAKVAVTGQYGDLQGLPVLAKVGTACGSGLFVQGIKADGSLECAAPVFKGGKCDVGQVVTEVKADGSVVCGAAAASLPADGLAAVSNGLLTNVFDEVYASATAPKSIPDNNPGGIIDEIVVPDTGTVKDISVSVNIDGQTTSSLVVTLFDPNNVAYVLHNKKDVGTTLDTSWPVPTKTVSGDLTTWVGQNPKGTWRLIVADWAAGGSAGTLKGWSVKVKVLSTKKVGVNGDLLANGATSGSCTMQQLDGPYQRPSYVIKCPGGQVDYQLARPLAVQVMQDGGACVLRGGKLQGGDVLCWGKSEKLSNVSDNFVSLACGTQSCCAINTKKQIKCWGSVNQYGELNAPPGAFTSVVAASKGYCALDTGGFATCWGQSVAQAPKDAFSMLAASDVSYCGVRTDGTLKCWGSNASGQLNVPQGTHVRVSLGYGHGCAVTTGGSIVCWGSNDSGQAKAPVGSTFNEVLAGDFRTCAIDTDGALQCWGDASYAGLSSIPAGRFLSGNMGGMWRGCAIRTYGGVACWGNAGFGETVPSELK